MADFSFVQNSAEAFKDRSGRPWRIFSEESTDLAGEENRDCDGVVLRP